MQTQVLAKENNNLLIIRIENTYVEIGKPGNQCQSQLSYPSINRTRKRLTTTTTPLKSPLQTVYITTNGNSAGDLASKLYHCQDCFGANEIDQKQRKLLLLSAWNLSFPQSQQATAPRMPRVSPQHHTHKTDNTLPTREVLCLFDRGATVIDPADLAQETIFIMGTRRWSTIVP
jgi:hypothetical protein